MNAIVLYKSKYGSTKQYAEWIAEEIGCQAVEAGRVRAEALAPYDTVIYGGGLYAEVIAGLTLLTKNMEKVKDKKIAVFSTGITPIDCRDYYDRLVLEKNFKNGVPENMRIFNFPGKMILSELSLPHRTAIKALKKLMSGKENPTEMERLLVQLCDADGDFTDKTAIAPLLEYVRGEK
ncbi:MAG: flavodoxin [Clostridia bacterium]|nr:flavodoxin [Clostridia bacterium]